MAYTKAQLDALITANLTPAGSDKITATELRAVFTAFALNAFKLPSKTPTSGAYTLVAADAGHVVRVDGNVTVNDGVFSADDIVTIRNISASEISIIEGSGVTITPDTDLTIPAYGYRALHFMSASAADISAGGVSSGGGGDVTAPTVVSATAASATTIVVVFSETVTATNVGWSFTKNGSAHNPTGVSGSGTNTLTFTVPTMLNTDTILRTYDSGTGDTMDAASNELVSFTGQAVTNSVPGSTTWPYLNAGLVEASSGLSRSEATGGSFDLWARHVTDVAPATRFIFRSPVDGEKYIGLSTNASPTSITADNYAGIRVLADGSIFYREGTSGTDINSGGATFGPGYEYCLYNTGALIIVQYRAVGDVTWINIHSFAPATAGATFKGIVSIKTQNAAFTDISIA